MIDNGTSGLPRLSRRSGYQEEFWQEAEVITAAIKIKTFKKHCAASDIQTLSSIYPWTDIKICSMTFLIFSCFSFSQSWNSHHQQECSAHWCGCCCLLLESCCLLLCCGGGEGELTLNWFVSLFSSHSDIQYCLELTSIMKILVSSIDCRSCDLSLSSLQSLLVPVGVALSQMGGALASPMPGPDRPWKQASYAKLSHPANAKWVEILIFQNIPNLRLTSLGLWWRGRRWVSQCPCIQVSPSSSLGRMAGQDISEAVTLSMWQNNLLFEQ